MHLAMAESCCQQPPKTARPTPWRRNFHSRLFWWSLAWDHFCVQVSYPQFLWLLLLLLLSCFSIYHSQSTTPENRAMPTRRNKSKLGKSNRFSFLDDDGCAGRNTAFAFVKWRFSPTDFPTRQKPNGRVTLHTYLTRRNMLWYPCVCSKIRKQ